MRKQKQLAHLLSFLFCCLFFFSCSRKLVLDRSQFLKDGDLTPTINLEAYKSVQERPGQDGDLAVALAISGGGSRASNFAVGIMMGLEQIEFDNGQNALNQIDYISTVSGGGFAGGAYLNSLYEHDYFRKEGKFLIKDYVDQHISEDLKVSYTSALLGGYFNPKVWFSYRDFGDVLERKIDDHVFGFRRRNNGQNTRSLVFADVFVPADSAHLNVKYPMLFANTSIVGTLAIFPFSPDILEAYKINGYTHRMKIIEEDVIDVYQIPLAVGVKASGSFPVLIPNSTLRSNRDNKRKFLHLMDGAMSDNQGFFTAMDVLKKDKNNRKVLLIIDADSSGNLYTFSKKEGAKSPMGIYFSLAASGLYARRATLINELPELEETEGVIPVFFGFNVLIKGNDYQLEEVKVHKKTEINRLIQLLKDDMSSLTDKDLHILYELLTNIGTKYTMRDDEQELLFLAGQKIVSMCETEIRAAMK